MSDIIETKKAILMSEWCIFVRALIDEGEKEILEREFFKDSRYYVAKNSYQVVFIIAIWMWLQFHLQLNASGIKHFQKMRS